MLGTVLIFVGVLLMLSHRSIGIVQARSQPRAVRPWTQAARLSGRIVFVIGAGLAAAGVLEVVDRLR